MTTEPREQRRIGRPPLPNPRVIPVRGMVSIAEFALIEATKGEETLSSFVRRHVLAACADAEQNSKIN